MDGRGSGLRGFVAELRRRRVFRVALVYAVVALAVIGLVGPLAGENPVAGQGVVWVAQVLMLVMVWLGLRLRGQGWVHFGLSFRGASRRIVGRAVWRSLVVFVAAVAALVAGAIVMANIVASPRVPT